MKNFSQNWVGEVFFSRILEKDVEYITEGKGLSVEMLVEKICHMNYEKITLVYTFY